MTTQGVFFNRSTNQWERRDPDSESELPQQGVFYDRLGDKWAYNPVTQGDVVYDDRYHGPRSTYNETSGTWVTSLSGETTPVNSYQGSVYIGPSGGWVQL